VRLKIGLSGSAQFHLTRRFQRFLRQIGAEIAPRQVLADAR
jgi:hypothetical protein